MDKLGVLAGMGPLAGNEFIKMLYEIEPQKNDIDYPQIIADYTTEIPSRTKSVLYDDVSPVYDTVLAINNLTSIGANYIAIPCNSIHYWYEEILSKIHKPWISMLDAVEEEIQSQGIDSVLVLGGDVTIQKELYKGRAKNVIYPTEREQIEIRKSIYGIKQQSISSNNSMLASIIDRYEGRIDAALLTCTELTIPFKNVYGLGTIKILDSVTIYAFKCLEVLKYGI